MAMETTTTQRADALIAWIEANRAAFDAWPAGALQVDWGGDGAGFRVKLTRSDRIGGGRAVAGERPAS